MRVFFVALTGPRFAASRTRVFDYLPFLKANGVQADVAVVLPDRISTWTYARRGFWRLIHYAWVWWRSFNVGVQTLRLAPRYHVVFVQRAFFSAPVPRLLRLFSRKVIFDFDDAIFTTEAPEEDWMARLRTWHHSRSLAGMLRASSRVIVENTYTASYAERFCPHVSIITGPIDTERYSPGSAGEEDDRVVLGWIGSYTSAPYLELIREPLAELGARHRHIRLCLIGEGGFDTDALPTEWRPWSLETEVRDLGRVDIGLMPLPDDPWTRGKGGYKLLQYLSMGIPAVSSPVGINTEIIEDGVSGFCASSHDEWVFCLDRLIRDRALRVRMGGAGRARMEARYSLQRSSRRLLRILHSVAGPEA